MRCLWLTPEVRGRAARDGGIGRLNAAGKRLTRGAVMSFARSVVVAVLVIQILGLLREVLFAVGIGGFINGLSGGDPTIIAGTIILLGSLALVVPVVRGNRWATVACIPLFLLLLAAALPALGEFWGRPGDDYGIWVTITTLMVSAAVGIPFAVIATREAFGARSASHFLAERGFSRSALSVTSAIAALAGMVVVGTAVAATPASNAATAFDRPPDEMTTLTMRDLRFEPDALSLAAGRTTAIFVVNEDPAPHSIDIDALGVHATVPGNQTTVVLVTPERSGTYELYCAVAGHADAGMVGSVQVE